ncbi:hypothetical protein RJ640_018775 [Escallonia rubra]|uniref:Mechanosensitive ion channel protein n=1 Tax=Escallonia rubra TaxID=112253 RepID=A0AA88UUI3_9ASTE|nr:hypothetical protein RJ640_018775 [Escallonia rubra]
MDPNGKLSNSSEISMPSDSSRRPADVVVVIPEREAKFKDVADSPQRGSAPASPSPNRPPRIPTNDTLTRRKTLVRSVYSKPKSRFGEQSVRIDSNMFEENPHEQIDQQGLNSPLKVASNRPSPNSRMTATSTTLKESFRALSITTPKTPLMGEDEAEEIYKKVSIRNKLKYRRVKMRVLVEWIAFVCILGCLVASLTVEKLEHCRLWSLEIWKWCVLVMVTICGMLVTNWFMHFVVLLIELNFLFRKKVLYFVHSLKKSVQVCIWLTLVLITWVLLFNNDGVPRSATANKVMNYVTWTIVTFLIGGFLWLLKTLLLKMLASSFHVNTFFDRVQESLFHQYILQTLSGPPLMGSAEMLARTESTSQLSFRSRKKAKEGKAKEVIDMDKLHQMKREKVSAWTMKMLVDVISNTGLSTLSNSLDESNYEGGAEQADKEITNEMEAIAAAYHIFRNVALPGNKYIDELDLRRFMIKEQVDLVLPLIDIAEKGEIDRKTLTEWVVKVYNGRKALAHALNDTKTAVKQLNKLVTGVLMVIIAIVWLLLMEIATTKVLVLLSSQLVVAAFMFGNTCKTIFEAIIFVFVMHPFDVGDRCVIDGVQLIVEEMNILTTVFLRFDNEKIYYPNSVLSTKPISNFYRSPDMGDSMEFCIDFTTPVERIGALKDKIKKYLEKNYQYWHPNHNVVVKEIENVNKIKIALFFNHTMNFQEYGEKNRRRSELVLEIKKIFEDLKIKYNLLPQEVNLVSPETTGINR